MTRASEIELKMAHCPACGAVMIPWSGTHGLVCPEPPIGCGQIKALYRADGWWRNGEPHHDDPRLAAGGRRS